MRAQVCICNVNILWFSAQWSQKSQTTFVMNVSSFAVSTSKRIFIAVKFVHEMAKDDFWDMH